MNTRLRRLGLTMSDVLVVETLLDFAQEQSAPRVWCSQQDLAERLEIKRSTVGDTFQRLTGRGLLLVVQEGRPGRATVYDYSPLIEAVWAVDVSDIEAKRKKEPSQPRRTTRPKADRAETSAPVVSTEAVDYSAVQALFATAPPSKDEIDTAVSVMSSDRWPITPRSVRNLIEEARAS